MIEKPFENWLPIPEYEELYEIDTFGNIKSLDRKVRNNNGFRVTKGKILKPKLDDKGYYKIGLTKDNKQKFYFIHRLVALTFIPNPNNYPIINHKDGNPKNNYVENLEWCTYSYNTKYAYKIGTKKPKGAEHIGEKNPKNKLTEKQVLNILNAKKDGIHIKKAFELLNYEISFSGFEQIWYGYKWKHLVEKVEE
jgi:hypothetical protein